MGRDLQAWKLGVHPDGSHGGGGGAGVSLVRRSRRRRLVTWVSGSRLRGKEERLELIFGSTHRSILKHPLAEPPKCVFFMVSCEAWINPSFYSTKTSCLSHPNVLF